LKPFSTVTFVDGGVAVVAVAVVVVVVVVAVVVVAVVVVGEVDDGISEFQS
jgi:hypothetical protein